MLARIRPDGNCLFASVAHAYQANNDSVTEIDDRQVRKWTVDWMRNYAEGPEGYRTSICNQVSGILRDLAEGVAVEGFSESYTNRLRLIALQGRNQAYLNREAFENYLGEMRKQGTWGGE